jgi:Uma2 family endonuclease
MSTISYSDVEIAPLIPPRRFSSAQYLWMIEKGILTRNDKVELINGIIVDKDEADPAIHRFSSEQYLEMIDEGIIDPGDRVELIGGIVVEMAPAGIPHNGFLITILNLFGPILEKYDIAVQGTLSIAEGHLFDPDFMLLHKRRDHYRSKLPEAPDVLLVVEAAESSLSRDRKIKLPSYGAAGIPEFWIADLRRKVIIVCREPDASSYKSIETRQGNDIVSPLAVPELSFAVSQAFE